MKKTHKKVFGLLGLVLVAAMTLFAVFMPEDKASAATATSYSDNISVVVIDEVPSVIITSPTSEEDVTSRNTPIHMSYTNLNHYTVTVTYTDEDGVEHTEVIDDVSPTEESGDVTYDFGPIAEQYGYGHYKVTLTGVGIDGSSVEDSVEFEHVAATADIKPNGEDGKVDIDLDYGDDDSKTEDEKVEKVEIEILDSDGNPIPGVPPIVVTPPTDHVVIDLSEYDLPDGDYIIKVTPYNKNGDVLPGGNSVRVHYDGSIVVPSTADTGGLFKGLNISSTDYLVTGLGVFLVVGIGGLVFVGKRNRR